MSPRTRRLLLLTAALAVVAVLVWLRLAQGGPPVAQIRVVDASGKPLAGVVIRPEGLRTKSGPYRSGWYSWSAKRNGVPNPPVRTDRDGMALIPYPKYVFEQIETGVICLAADHPDYVPDRPECTVSTTPPAGAPIQVLLKYWLKRLQHGALISRPDSIVLKKGAVLRLSVKPDAAGPTNAALFAEVSSLSATDTNTWRRPEPGVLVTRRLAPGPFTARAIKIQTNGTTWFSEVISNTAVAGQTNSLEVALRPGVTLRGKLDDSVPRPVRRGRVIAHVWPQGFKPETSPPQWHAWAKVSDDGEFEIDSLPPGDLEVVALCDGFVSTNGPGQFGMRYPQKHILGTNDLTITIGMEPTARLEVEVSDDKGNPLEGALVSTWPNVRYGEWAAVILASDCYNSADGFFLPPDKQARWWDRQVPDFEGTTDSNGLAVLANLPPDVKQFSVQHTQFALPAIKLPGWGREERIAPVTLIAGETNHASVQLEPINQAPISQY